MRWTIVALAATGALVLSSNAQAQLRIVATLPDLAAIARAVGGERASVTALASPNQDPHYVDGRPSMILPLNKADLVIVNGLDLEIGWLPPLLINARNSKIQPGSPGYLDASSVVKRLDVNTTADRAQGDVHPGGNPHFLLDPRAAIGIADAVLKRATALDAAGTATFEKNHHTLVTQLEALATAQTKRFGALTPKRRQVVAYHGSLPYLWDWLGLTQIATLEPKPGIAPTPGDLARVLAVMRAQGAHVIAQEAYYPTRTSETVAKLVKGDVAVLPGGTKFETGQSYIEHMTEVADVLFIALDREAAGRP